MLDMVDKVIKDS
jgi:hypothetical protein